MDKIFCPNCYDEFEFEPSTCNTCGFPFNGTEIEKQRFLSLRAINKNLKAEAKKSIKFSRIILFLIGAINLIVNILIILSSNETLITLPALGASLLMIILGIFSYKDPFYFLLLGFIVLIFMYLLAVFIDPKELLSGIVLKIFFISSFITGLVTIKRSNKVQKLIQNE